MPKTPELSLQEKTQRLRVVLSKLATDGGGLDSVSSSLESMLESAGDIEPAKDALNQLNQLHPGESLDPDAAGQLEAIVLPKLRPAVIISGGSFPTPPAPWKHLGDVPVRDRLESAFRSIGRVELTGSTAPYAGTAFVVGPHLMMTNRHVAEAFTIGLGQKSLIFRPGRSAGVDFGFEDGQAAGISLQVRKVLMIHPYWDMALLDVAGLDSRHPQLTLDSLPFDELAANQAEVAVVGYPAFDPRNPDKALQDEIFQSKYQIKRLQPGKLQPRLDFTSYKRLVRAGVHDASTLGGNSGSAVIDINTGRVVALHFAGEYLKANYAVPASELAQDARVVQAGVQFTPGAGPSEFYGTVWSALEKTETVAATAAVGSGGNPPTGHLAGNAGANSGAGGFGGPGINLTLPAGSGGGLASVTIHIPLQITITVGTPQVTTHPQGSSGAPAVAGGTEGLFNWGKPPVREPLAGFDLASLVEREDFWQRAKSLALASQLAYWEPAVVTSRGTPSLETTLRNWGFGSIQFLSRGATQGFFAATSDTVLVAFRGTTNLADWYANLKLFDTHQSYGPVHRGFRSQFQDVKSDLEQLLEAHPHRQLFVTGHSLGGALACIAAAEWCQRAVPPTAIFTYGQPRTGHGTFVRLIADQYPDRYHRFVNDRDVVPTVPPGYEHVGRLWKFKQSGQLDLNARESITDTPDFEEEAVSVGQFQAIQEQLRKGATLEQILGAAGGGDAHVEGLFPPIDDHAIDKYIDKIDKFVVTATA